MGGRFGIVAGTLRVPELVLATMGTCRSTETAKRRMNTNTSGLTHTQEEVNDRTYTISWVVAFFKREVGKFSRKPRRRRGHRGLGRIGREAIEEHESALITLIRIRDNHGASKQTQPCGVSPREQGERSGIQATERRHGVAGEG